jgi:hypothetical protein
MLWARLLAYVTGTVNQELLLRNEYLAAENRILRGQIKGRLLLSEGEKATLAEIAHLSFAKTLQGHKSRPVTMLQARRLLFISNPLWILARDSAGVLVHLLILPWFDRRTASVR